MGRRRLLIAALVASPLAAYAAQGAPVYTSVPTYPVAGAACSGSRVQIQANNGAPWCCVSSHWQTCAAFDAGGVSTVTATGSTTPRFLADRFADTFSVKDFGAKGDGVTDDTAAIQAANNAGRYLYVPAGTYKTSSTISWGRADGSGVTVEIDPAAKFVPAAGSFDMFLLLPGARVQGLTVDVTGDPAYAATVVKLAGYKYDNQPNGALGYTGRTALDDFTLYARGNTAATGLGIRSTGLTDFVQFVDFNRISIQGGFYGVHAVASGTGWVNGNTFTGVRVTNAVHDFVIDGGTRGGGDTCQAAGNIVIGYQAEYQADDPPVGLDGIWLAGEAHLNSFIGTKVWDFVSGGGRASVRFTGNASGNEVRGYVDITLVSDASGDYNHVDDLFWGQSMGRLVHNNGRIAAPIVYATDQAQGIGLGTTPDLVLQGDGSNMYLHPQNLSSGWVYIQTANNTKNWAFKNTGDMVPPGSIIGLSPGTDGAAGQTGKVYQGSGAPNNANGNNGDIYFRTDTPGTANQRVYMKNSGSWVGIL